jgi:hypothetical protein
MARAAVGVIIAGLCWSAPLAAQPARVANPWLRAAVNGVRDAAHARDLSLRRLDIAVELRGAVAETVVDASFANPGDETLEGDFRLALPASAVVTGYALNIGRQMVDGVLVDRPRAKAVYDERVRRGVDPGIAEVTPDNVFETHIDPIFPHQGRSIRLRFVAPVGPNGLHLPIGIAAPQEGWSLAVHASGMATAPSLSAPGGKLRFERVADGFAAKLSGGATALAGELAIGQPDAPGVLVSQHFTGERDLQLSGALPPSGAGGAAGHLRVYWARSRAHKDSDFAVEIALLREVISRLHPAGIELVAFNSAGADRHTVASANEAAAWLQGLRYRGATSYAALAQDGVTDRCLLFAPGGPDIDRHVSFAPRCQLDTVSAAMNVDATWLRHVALVRGGGFHEVTAASASEVA